MKRILITGADSYIGISLEQWLARYPKQYQIDTVETISTKWKRVDFGEYDTIFHVAGIAHADVSKVSEIVRQRYYDVNCDLAFAIAQKAKEEKVGQFIFMSSMSVYSETIGTRGTMITQETIPKPSNCYGDSKLQAEKKLATLSDDSFHLAILRPPMIYGKGSKGNYPILVKIARRAPLFPDIKNNRSMLYIDNMCEFVRLIIDNRESGLFFPQNGEYVKTSEMVRLIARAHGRRMILIPFPNRIVHLLCKAPGKIGKLTNKAFGSMQYEMKMSDYKVNYRVRNLVNSIRSTEK